MSGATNPRIVEFSRGRFSVIIDNIVMIGGEWVNLPTFLKDDRSYIRIFRNKRAAARALLAFTTGDIHDLERS